MDVTHKGLIKMDAMSRLHFESTSTPKSHCIYIHVSPIIAAREGSIDNKSA